MSSTHLAKVVKPISEEAAISMSMNIGQPEGMVEAYSHILHFTPDTDVLTEWKDIHLKPVILETVARLSSRVFVGELCRDEHWYYSKIVLFP